MNNLRHFIATLLFGMIATGFSILAGNATAQTDSLFTYQGQLSLRGSPAIGSFTMEFSLWNAPVNGSQLDATGPMTVEVDDGRFSVDLDFGADSFNNANRWIEVKVEGTTLSPRNLVTRVPYAIQTRGIVVKENGSVGIGTATPASEAKMTLVATSDGYALIALSTDSTEPTISAVNIGGGHAIQAGGSSDVSLAGGGLIVAGVEGELNIAIDTNEIMSRNDGEPSTLLLNREGGNVAIGTASGGTSTLSAPIVAAVEIRSGSANTHPAYAYGKVNFDGTSVVSIVSSSSNVTGATLHGDGEFRVGFAGGLQADDIVMVSARSSSANASAFINADGQMSVTGRDIESGDVRPFSFSFVVYRP